MFIIKLDFKNFLKFVSRFPAFNLDVIQAYQKSAKKTQNFFDLVFLKNIRQKQNNEGYFYTFKTVGLEQKLSDDVTLAFFAGKHLFYVSQGFCF